MGRVARRAALTATVLFAAGCSEATEPEVDVSSSFVSAPTEVTLKYGEEVKLNDVLRIAFGQVIQDSRCAVDVQCVWAGNAEIEIGVAAGMGPTYPLRLNTGVEPRSTVWMGLRITLEEVLPLPLSGQDRKPEDYSIKLLVEATR
jgi:hypothetical protein